MTSSTTNRTMMRTLPRWLPAIELPSSMSMPSVVSEAGKRKYISTANSSHCTQSFPTVSFHDLHKSLRQNTGVKPLSLHCKLSDHRAFSSNAVAYGDADECELSIDVGDASVHRNNSGTGAPHCKTCTCSKATNDSIHEQNKHIKTQQLQLDKDNDHFDPSIPIAPITPNSNNPTKCHLPTPLFDPQTPLPPPLPSPTYSFSRRILPPNLTAFNSPQGKSRFLRSLSTQNAEAYYPLSQQFLNQSDPAYCGVTTLILILNALAIDPNVRWKGGWRWYGNESMLLEHCCLEEERVAREGISVDMFGGLARCQGVGVEVKRPFDDATVAEVDDHDMMKNTEQCYGIDEFRQDIINAVRNPPNTGLDTELDENNLKDNTLNNNLHQSPSGGYFLVTSFSRSSLNQTGEGHFSPIAAYDPPTDSCLILDVARFKYAPYWVSIQDLYEAMIPHDAMTNRSRGWILMYPPSSKPSTLKELSKEEMEGKRLAACVPAAGSGVSICPVEKIKKEYCAVNGVLT